MCFVYILFSDSLKKFYVGSTTGLPESRLRKHLTDHKGYTAKSKDWKIVFTEKTSSKSDALIREKQIKAWKSHDLIRNLIDKSDPKP